MAGMISGRSVRLAVKSKSWSPTQTEWKHAAQCVQPEEKERIGKFIFKKDAKSAMVGRLLMRYAVAKMLDVPYRALSFERTEKGKPYLTSPVDKCSPRCDVSFNISHQGDYVVFAGERGKLVGVDVMNVEWPRTRPISDFLESMSEQLTGHEWSEVKRRNGDMAQLKTFYRLWCLKESLVKALGTGIGFEVNRLNFRFGTPELSPGQLVTDTKVDIDGVSAPMWKIEETQIEDHCVAVAIQDPARDKITSGDKEEATPFQVIEIQDLLVCCEPLVGTEPDHAYWEVFNNRLEAPR